MNAINTFFIETWNELVHKVSWPTFDDLQSSLIVVSIATLIITLVVWGMNETANLTLSTIYHLFQ